MVIQAPRLKLIMLLIKPDQDAVYVIRRMKLEHVQLLKHTTRQCKSYNTMDLTVAG